LLQVRNARCPDAGASPGPKPGGTELELSDPSDRSPAPGILLFAFNEPADVAAAKPSASTQAGILNARASLSWDGEQGDPDNGSLRIDVPFDAYNQSIDLQFPLASPSDLSGKVAYLRIKLDSGFNPDRSAPGGMIFYAQSGDDYAWGQAEWTNVLQSTQGKWREYSLEMSFPWREVSATGVQGSALSFDPARVRLLGLILHTGGGGSSPTAPTPALFHLDSIGYWDPAQLE